jgi:hypothetical protein
MPTKRCGGPPSNTNPSYLLMNSSMIVFIASSEFSVSSTLQVPMMGAMDSKVASSTPTLFNLPHSEKLQNLLEEFCSFS